MGTKRSSLPNPVTVERRRGDSFPSIASEINNALTVILGNAQLLQVKDTLAPEARAKLKAIVDSSFRIHALVEEFFQGNTRLS